jgi:lipopolysaccharide transport system ATP-binding protein
MNSLTVDRLGKCYRLGGNPDNKSPFGLARRAWQRLGRRSAEATDSEKPREFWALKDVSFAIGPGTVLGVIGANGAGKTTLLKILARVITPTEGRVDGWGRVVSLLELGAGFDPDLTARDNIFLNAAMLGIPRAVVMRRFDQIIDFAEVDKFVDTPLKHYSSGMYLRLAFSVAINMEPAILLADEILAVGDLSFQERCLERVKQDAERGLMVLFVSHDMNAIVRVCNQTLWLNAGSVMQLGDSEGVVADYQNSVWARGAQALEHGRHANRYAALHDVRIITADGREVRGLRTDQHVYLRMRFQLFQRHMYVRAAFDLRSKAHLVFRSSDTHMRYFREDGIWEARMRLPSNFFSETTYTVVPSITVTPREDARRYTLMVDPLSFIVYAPDDAGKDPPDGRPSGLLSPRFKWTFQQVEEELEQTEKTVDV